MTNPTKYVPHYEVAYGDKYAATKDLNTTQIAKLIRADIKAAVAARHLPAGLKTSVRTEYYSGGSSINVEVTACPNVTLLNPERVKFDLANPHNHLNNVDRDYPKYTTNYVAIENALKIIVGAYNFDGSDSQVDYFHVRFYGHVGFAWELEKAEKAALEIAIKSDEAAKALGDAEPHSAEALEAYEESIKPVLTPSTCVPLAPFPKNDNCQNTTTPSVKEHDDDVATFCCEI